MDVPTATLRLDDLPPALAAHVEACRSEGIDLLPWIDPYRPTPEAPIVAWVSRWDPSPPQKSAVMRLVRDEGMFDERDLVAPVVHRWLWWQVSNRGLTPLSARTYLHAIKDFARVLPDGGLAARSLDAIQVTRHRRRVPLETQEGILRELGKEHGKWGEQRRIARQFGVRPMVVNRLCRRGAVDPTAELLYVTEEPRWRRKHDDDTWWLLGAYEAYGEPTYRDSDAMLRAWAERQGTESGGREEWRRLYKRLCRARKTEDHALLRRARQGQAIGNYDLLRTLLRWMYALEGAPTFRSMATIRECMIGWPQRVAVAIGGWSNRYPPKPKGRGRGQIQWFIYGDGAQTRGAVDRRGTILLGWIEDEGMTLATARRRWNQLPLVERKMRSPGNCRPIDSDSSARGLVTNARTAKNSTIKRPISGATVAWPAASEAERARVLRDQQSWSWARIRREFKLSTNFNAYQLVWDGRVSAAPRDALEGMRHETSYRRGGEVVALVDQGMSCGDVAKAIGVPRSTVVGRLKAGRWWRALERRAEELAAAAGPAAPRTTRSANKSAGKVEARAGGRKKSPIREIIKELLEKDPELTARQLARRVKQRLGKQPTDSYVRTLQVRMRKAGEI
jgi:transposase